MERNLPDNPASLKKYYQKDVMNISNIDFKILFPLDYLKQVIIPQKNKKLKEPTDVYDLLRFIVCCFYMVCWEGIPSRHSWWSVTTTDIFHGSHFLLNEYISRNSFDDILGALRYTNEEVHYTDTFLKMRQMEKLWNKNMEGKLNPGWINVMDKSIKGLFNN